MPNKTNRILATHAGTLPRPAALTQMIFARGDGKPYDQVALDALLTASVAAIVRQQIEAGIDCVNDGEFNKTTFSNYVRERMAGYEVRHYKPGEGPARLSIAARD